MPIPLTPAMTPLNLRNGWGGARKFYLGVHKIRRTTKSQKKLCCTLVGYPKPTSSASSNQGHYLLHNYYQWKAFGILKEEGSLSFYIMSNIHHYLSSYKSRKISIIGAHYPDGCHLRALNPSKKHMNATSSKRNLSFIEGRSIIKRYPDDILPREQ